MKHTKISKILLALFAVVLCFGPVGLAEPLGTAFTYQGRLIDNNQPADGLYDLQFKLYDAASVGNQLNNEVNIPETQVDDGYFTVDVNFGNSFDGNERWLDIGVRPGELEDPNVYTVLSPRQEITPTPYALYAKNGGGGGGESLWQLNGTSIYYNNGNVGIGTTSPSAKLEVAGQVKITGGSPAESKVLASDSTGLATWQTLTETDPTVLASVKDGVSWGEVSGIPAGFADGVDDVGAADNLGNHTATQNVKLNGYWLSGDGGWEGVYVTNVGNVGIGTNSPTSNLDVYGNINCSDSYKLKTITVLADNGPDNFFIGEGAGTNTIIGNENSAIGKNALHLNTSGFGNSVIGANALYSNTYGWYNSAIGTYALYNNTEGQENTAVGNYSLYSNITGGQNSAMGREALMANTSGHQNIAIGAYALQANTTGLQNSAIGVWSLYRNTIGRENVAIGLSALFSNTTGSYNTALGSGAGSYVSTGNNNVFLGRYAGYFETGSNKLYIANDAADANVLIYGDFSTGRVGISLINPTEALDVDGTARLRGIGTGSGTTVVADATGKLWKQSSSQRYKTNIEALDTGLDAVLNLIPVRFEYKESGQKDIGLIAEEVEKISPDLVIYDGDGRPDAVKYDKVALYLLSVIKNQQKENEDIKARLSVMELQMAKLSLQKEGDIK